MIEACFALYHVDSQVTVALQLSDGSRLKNSFPSTTSLWDIIQYWESRHAR